jgi:predicted permease
MFRMRSLRAALLRLGALVRPGTLDRDLAAEMESHLQLHIDDNLRAGMTPAEARRQAILSLGGIEQAKEQYRDRRGVPSLEAFLRDVRFAGRMLRKQPAFTLSALAMLTLGLALAAGTFTLFNGVFVRGWTVPDSGQVFRVEASRKVQPAAGIIFDGLSLGAYRHIRAHARASDYVGYWFDNMRMRPDRSAAATNTRTVVVSDNFISALRIPLGHGAMPAPASAAPPAVLVTDRTWRRVFGADPSIVGRTAWINDAAVTIAGVTAAGFESLGDSVIEVIVPIATVRQVDSSADTLENLDEGQCCIRVAGRLRDGRTREEARAELEILTAQYRQSVRQPDLSVRLAGTTQGETISGDEEPVAAVFALVSAGVLLVFLLTCTNVGNLFLARSLSRRREIAVRLSLGATRTRIVQQLVVEGFVLASIAGAAAFLATMAIPTLFLLVDEREPAIAAMLASDWRVAAFTSAFVILTCLIVSLAPALHTTRIAWRGAGPGVPQATGRLRRGILAAQIAVATVLVLSATLLTRGIERALATPADFALHTTTAAILQVPPGRPWDAAAARRLHAALAGEARASEVPIGLSGVDLRGDNGLSVFYTRVKEPQSEALFGAHVVPVAEAAPEILGLRLASGRWPSTDAAALEAVVNRTLAENMWGGQDAVGRSVALGVANDRVYTIVGVAADAHLTALDDIAPVIHLASSPISLPVVVARTARNVDERLRRLVTAVDPNLIVSVVPLSQPFEQTLRQARTGAAVAGALGAIAIALAIVGIFSVFAYLVEERRQEIGVRLALGASRAHVGLAIFHATRNAVAGGLLVGLGLAVAAGVALRGFLFGLSPVDPISYAIVALILGASAAVATAIPVRRAVRIAPVTALRAE